MRQVINNDVLDFSVHCCQHLLSNITHCVWISLPIFAMAGPGPLQAHFPFLRVVLNSSVGHISALKTHSNSPGEKN